MTLAFVMIRGNQWPWLKPVWEAARSQGHDVRIFGPPLVWPEINRALDGLPDAVAVSVLMVPDGSNGEGSWRGPWIGIQHRVTDLLYLRDPARYAAVCVWSSSWLDWFACYRAIHPAAEARVGPPQAIQALRDRAVVVGATLADLTHRADPATTRRRFDLPARFVVYLPFPARGNREGRWAWRYAAPWPWGTEWEFVRTLRRACDRADVGLVLKGRRKTPIPRWITRLADCVIEEDEPWEPTLLHVLEAGAVRLFHWMSCSVVEAALAGVPSVCLAPEVGTWPPYHARRVRVPKLEPLIGAYQGGFFAGWGEAVCGMEPRHAVRWLGRLEDSFAITPTEPMLRRYREMLLGESGAGKRIVDEASRQVRLPSSGKVLATRLT